MKSSFDPGALLARSYALPRGPRVRLRLARVRDADGIRALIERQGLACEELEIARLVRSDPRTQIVICATALLGLRETVVGIGAIALQPGRVSAPHTQLVDEQLTDGLGELLSSALVGRAAALASNRAA